MSPRTLFASFTARPGHEAAVERLIIELARTVRLEPGNRAFAVSRRRESPREFFVYEEYVDDDAFDRHVTADYVSEFNSRLGALIEEEHSQLHWLDPVS